MLSKSIKTRIAARFRYNPFFRYFWQASGTALAPKKWCFILGCYNSGTTLLQEILSRHPLISSLEDEGVILTGYLNRPEDFGWNRMWFPCYDQVKLDGRTENFRIAEKVKRQWSHFYSKTRESILLEKSIVNATRIPFLNTFFSPACFIYIVRNGYVVSEGIHRKASPGKVNNTLYHDKYPIELCARQWQASHDVVEKESAQVLNFLKIHYEDLVANPAEVILRITDFLGIPPLSDNLFTQEFNIHSLHSQIANQNQKSFERLSEGEIEKIEEVAMQALIANNYYRKFQ